MSEIPQPKQVYLLSDTSGGESEELRSATDASIAFDIQRSVVSVSVFDNTREQFRSSFTLTSRVDDK
ncbi:MAG: hypothetical protein AAB592_05540 [Patescibacteria group bacterium]